jgi:hypothetical protein
LDANLLFELRRVLEPAVVNSIIKVQDLLGVNVRILKGRRHARHEVEASFLLSNKRDEPFISVKDSFWVATESVRLVPLLIQLN